MSTDAGATIRVVTYTSVNAPAGYEAVTHLWLDGERLPISFNAPSPQGAQDKARAYWDGVVAKHGPSMANRAEGRRKAAEARAQKASQTRPADAGEGALAPNEPNFPEEQA